MTMNRYSNQMYSQRLINSPQKGFNTRNINPSKMQLTELAGKGMDGLSKTLTNVQQVLHVIQSTAPVVQEYGPMIKNLPAMYRMMKAFKEIDKEEETTTESLKEKDTDTIKNKINKDDEIKPKSIPTNIKTNGQSTPKLYI